MLLRCTLQCLQRWKVLWGVLQNHLVFARMETFHIIKKKEDHDPSVQTKHKHASKICSNMGLGWDVLPEPAQEKNAKWHINRHAHKMQAWMHATLYISLQANRIGSSTTKWNIWSFSRAEAKFLQAHSKSFSVPDMMTPPSLPCQPLHSRFVLRRYVEEHSERH